MSHTRRVLGVDPGLAATGFGIVDGDGRSAHCVAAGAIRTSPKRTRAERLAEIAGRVAVLIDEHAPHELAIEQQYVAQNVRSAMAIGEVRAAVMVAAAQRGLAVHEYSPSAVKQAVTGYGAALKEQVRHMVMVQLALTVEPAPLDASDALAVALTRLADLRLEDALAASGRG